MGASDQNAALAAVRATSVPIHDIGTAIYLSPDVMALAAESGWTNPFAFYFAGRGGMLGDVNADVVTAAFGWFEPNAVAAMYTEGVGRGRREGRSGAHGRGARGVGHDALRRRRGYRRHRGGHRAVGRRDRGIGHPALRGLARRGALGRRRGASRPAHADAAGVARRVPPRGHHRRRALTPRGDPDQRGRGPGEVLRVVRALCRRQRDQGQARRSGGDHRPAVRLDAGRRARRLPVRRVRGRRARPCGQPPRRRRRAWPGGGPETGTD